MLQGLEIGIIEKRIRGFIKELPEFLTKNEKL
jgi:hypothetical protein